MEELVEVLEYEEEEEADRQFLFIEASDLFSTIVIEFLLTEHEESFEFVVRLIPFIFTFIFSLFVIMSCFSSFFLIFISFFFFISSFEFNTELWLFSFEEFELTFSILIPIKKY